MTKSEDGDFGWALAQMRAGEKVRRRTWSVDEWVKIENGRRIVNEDGSPCVFRDSDPLLATDWVLA